MDTPSSPPAAPVEPPPRSSSSSAWKNLLKILLALLLTGAVLSRTDVQQIIAISRSASWIWLAASLLLFCLMTALKGMQYWVLLGGRVSYRQTARVVVIQNAITNLIATTAGIASYLTLLRLEQNVKLRHSGIAFIITKAGDLFSLILFLLLSAWLVWDRVGALQQLVIFLAAGSFLAFGLFWITVFFRQKFVTQIEGLFHWLRLDRVAFVTRGVEVMRSLAEQDYKTVVRTLLSGLALSLFYTIIAMVYAYCRIQAFHVPLGIWEIVFITSLLQLVSLIPIQVFGGLGVIEFASVYLYELFGVTQIDVPATLISLRVVFYLFNLIVVLYLPLEALFDRFARWRSP